MNSPRNIAKIGRLAAWATRVYLMIGVAELMVFIISFASHELYISFLYWERMILGRLGLMLEVADLIVVAAISVLIINAVWLVRAARNAAEFDPHPKSFSGGWTLGWFFIPIANLWMPFRAIRYMWNVSIKGPSHGDDKAPRFFLIWWGCWVAEPVVVLGTIITRTTLLLTGSLDADLWLHESKLFYILEYLPILFDCIATYFFLRIIRTVTDAQVHGDQRRLANVFE